MLEQRRWKLDCWELFLIHWSTLILPIYFTSCSLGEILKPYGVQSRRLRFQRNLQQVELNVSLLGALSQLVEMFWNHEGQCLSSKEKFRLWNNKVGVLDCVHWPTNETCLNYQAMLPTWLVLLNCYYLSYLISFPTISFLRRCDDDILFALAEAAVVGATILTSLQWWYRICNSWDFSCLC